MTMELGANLFTYLTNAVAFFVLSLLIARVGPSQRFRVLRVSALTILVLADAAFLLWVYCSGLSIGMLAVLVCLAATTFRPGLTSGLNEALGGARFGVFVGSVLTTAALFYIYLP